MVDLSLSPVYLSARAAIVAPERAIPTSIYAVQKWLPRLGSQRWCLIMILRGLCIDAPRQSNGTKQVVCAWSELAEMLDIHQETLASWFKHEPIHNESPWHKIIPVDEKAKYLSVFIPRLRHAYDTHNGRSRRIGFIMEILMEDPIIPEDEARLMHHVEMLALQQGQFELTPDVNTEIPTSPKLVSSHLPFSTNSVNRNFLGLQQVVNAEFSDLQFSRKFVNAEKTDLQRFVNAENPDLQFSRKFVNAEKTDLQRFVNAENPDLQKFVNAENPDLQNIVNAEKTDLQISKKVVNAEKTDLQIFGRVVNAEKTDLQISRMVVNAENTDLQFGENLTISPSQSRNGVVNAEKTDLQRVNSPFPGLQNQQLVVNSGSAGLLKVVNAENPDLQNFVNAENPDLQIVVNAENPDLQNLFKVVNAEKTDLQNSFKVVNAENPDLQNLFKVVNAENPDLQPVVNAENPDLQTDFSCSVNVNVNVILLLLEDLNVNVNVNAADKKFEIFEQIVEHTKILLEDDHSTPMFHKALNILYPNQLELYANALEAVFKPGESKYILNKGAFFVRTLGKLCQAAGVDLGLKSTNGNGAKNGHGNSQLTAVPQISLELPRPTVILSAAEKIWQEACLTLRHQMTRATYDTVIKPTVFLEYKNNGYVIGTQTLQAKEWLEKRLLDMIERTLASITGKMTTVEFKLL